MRLYLVYDGDYCIGYCDEYSVRANELNGLECVYWGTFWA